MKHSHPKTEKRRRSGAVLIVVLWVLTILSVLAVGLGRRTQIDLSLTKYFLGKVKSYYACRAGIVYAMNLLKKDIRDPDTGQFDNLYQCGFKLEGASAEEIFKDIPVGESSFDIGYKSNKENIEEDQTYYGFEDEERKINLNALTMQNYNIFKQLLVLLDVDDETAETVAASLVDWTDADDAVTNSPFGAEEDKYRELEVPYGCKNSGLNSLEEIQLVRGMTQEIFSRMKEYITIYPQKASGVSLNVNTASETVLRALARSVAGGMTNTETEDADNMVAKIIAYRNGEDRLEATEDDRLVDLNELALNAKERALFLAAKNRMTNVSNCFRIKAKGVHQTSFIETSIEAVVDRRDFSVVYWRRD